MSVIYLHELPKKGPVLSRAARLFFGGISNVARTPGASRPAVPLHLGMLERLAMTVTFLGCALPVYLTQTTKGHTRPLHRPPRTVALDNRSLNPTHHLLLHGEIAVLKTLDAWKCNSHFGHAPCLALDPELKTQRPAVSMADVTQTLLLLCRGWATSGYRQETNPVNVMN